jgi:hypothetical protein
MLEDKHNNGPRDGKRINMHEDYEVRCWTKALSVSKQ